MNKAIEQLQAQLKEAINYYQQATDDDLLYRRAVGKWSKKEILGHLIDSALHNLQRFTEIQFSDKPYIYRKYMQDELVVANKYQEADLQELLDVWLSLNNRVIHLMKIQTEQTLAYEIKLDENENIDLRFLMTDYVDHMAHHLKAVL